jgi:glycosyltransferase involved in cell wall biosynthesis
MKLSLKTYLMILPVPYFRVNDTTVAVESAFVGHLKLLKAKISPVFNHLVIGMVEMSSEEYAQKKSSLTLVDETVEDLDFKTVYRVAELSSGLGRLKALIAVSKRLKTLIKTCDLLHTGLSANIWFPMEFVAVLCGAYFKKPIVYVVDIDFRNSALMNYKTGRWSLKSYLICRYIYDGFRKFQINYAVNRCQLLLLKGKKMAEDFGKGNAHVKNFMDAAHSAQHIVSADALEQKRQLLSNKANGPLEVVYFGRLTPYKGVDMCIRAIALAHQKHGIDVVFNVIGDGEQAADLKKLAEELAIADRVIFHGALPFNLDFFKKLYGYHVLLATPLSEDTPRSALDAMAAGIPILAFDTYYYEDLTSSGAVATVPWLSVDGLAERLAYYSEHTGLLADMTQHAVEFAQQNTQEIWLDRRFTWTLELAGLTSSNQ